MHRKIRTRDESASGVLFEILFSLCWYAALLSAFLKGGGMRDKIYLLPFLAAGLMPVYMAVRKIRRASYYRGLHKKYMQSVPRRGRITGCRRQYYKEQGSRGRLITRTEYILTVEVYDAERPQPFEIYSEPYSWPVYRVLSSPEVEVYTDETGWHHVIDGFHYKQKKSDPGILLESPFDRGRDEGENRIFYIIAVVVMLLMLLGNFSSFWKFW